jgi:hypothetical protein
VRALSSPVALPRTAGGTVAVRLEKPADLSWSDIDAVAFVQSQVTGEIGGTLLIGTRTSWPSPTR